MLHSIHVLSREKAVDNNMNTIPIGTIEKYGQSALQAATQHGAMQCLLGIGGGDKFLLDDVATRTQLEKLREVTPVPITCVIGEGKKDGASGIFPGMEIKPSYDLGGGEYYIELAADPLDGTSAAADNTPGAISVLAGSVRQQGDHKSGLWGAPEGYAEKIMISSQLATAWWEFCNSTKCFALEGKPLVKGVPLLDQNLATFLTFAREVLGRRVAVEFLTGRPRNEYVMEAIRQAGALPHPIQSGDVASAVRIQEDYHNVDIYAGIGGSPEGVIAAAVLKCADGYMEMRPWFSNDAEGEEDRAELIASKIDPTKVYTMDDLVPGDAFFSMTAVTEACFGRGVRYTTGTQIETVSYTGRSRTGSTNVTQTLHREPPVLVLANR